MFTILVSLSVLVWVAFYIFTRAPKSATVDVTAAKRSLGSDAGLQLIDVRTEMEYAAGHLPAARLIPLQQLGSRLSEIDPQKPVLLYCRSGHRSAMALQILTKKGYSQARHLQGGFLAWEAAGNPVEK